MKGYNMTLRHFKIFVSVCEYKSITVAAEKLFLAQPTVSLAIKEMEGYYGVKLFDRISRKLYLTEVGKQFLDYTTHIVSLYDEMEKGIKDWDSFDILRIGASITIGTYLLPKYVSECYITHPKIKIQVLIDNSAEIEKQVMENRVDFALIEGEIHNSQIISKKFMKDELILICGMNHPLAETEKIDLDQLGKYDFILREKGSGTRELFDSTMLINEIVIKPVWESVSTQAIIQAVTAGLGLSVLSYRMVESDLEMKHVKQIGINNVKFLRNFFIIYHKNKFLTNSAKEFMDLVNQNC
jgi:DNA-binding transcriptional LysR family regulator